jgi:uncharacterized protein (DUF1800 family)
MLWPTQRKHFAVTLALVLIGAGGVAAVAGKHEKKSPPGQMDESKRALHALNRLTFGPRPGDVQRVAAIGVDKWIDEQLHPEHISDAALEARLAPLRTIRMNTRELVENFPPPQVIKAVMDGKERLPSDPVKRAVYQAQIDKIEHKDDQKKTAASVPANTFAAPNPDASAPIAANADSNTTNATKPNASASASMAGGPVASDTTTNATAPPPSGKGKRTPEQIAQKQEDKLFADLKAQELLDLPPDERMKRVLEMSPEDQRAMATSLKGAKADQFREGMSPKQRETLQALNNPQQVVNDELMQAKLLRAIYSERQLDEVMTDFWFNHFNVFLGKGADRYMVTSYERDVIRPHALGKFEDLLVATAQSPAMLFYLDNWLSAGPNSEVAIGVDLRKHARNRNPYARPHPRKKGSGLNENYGRELMELHTLGVNGGYTQKDVTEVARVLTGWTIEEPRKGGGFKYEEKLHEPGDKLVLGHRIKEGGEKEGRQVLHLLAHHPSTAHFICTKLAMRFVSDNPPSALVDRMAQTFLKKDGDIREVLKTMFKSPEFWGDEAYRAKVKTPLEFVVSAARATNADITDAMTLARQLNNMGMPLYGMQPPTGYSMKAETWVNSSALLDRMNFSLALMTGKLKGTQVDVAQLIPPSATPADAHDALAQMETTLLAGDVSKQTHAAIAKRLDDPQVAQRKLDDPARAPNLGMIAGLIVGSPDFQRR